jgi:hypothetical protein
MAALREDIVHLDPEKLSANFPRDRRGLLPLRESVFLAGYTSPAKDGRGKVREAWLVALSPEKRSAKQIVTLDLLARSGKNARKRWDAARRFWDSRVEPTESEEAGAPGVREILEDSGCDRRAIELRCAEGTASEAERIALAVMLQNEGRGKQALEIFGVILGK